MWLLCSGVSTGLGLVIGHLEKQRWDEQSKAPKKATQWMPIFYHMLAKSSASRTWWFIFKVKSSNFWWKVWVWVKFSVCVAMCMYTCVYVFWYTVHAPCGLAAAAAWPESRPPMQCLWECGEFGWDQLIKHCTLALSCFPYRQGKRWPMGKPHRQPVSGASLYCCFFFHSHICCNSADQGSGTLTFGHWGLVSENSFTSPEQRRMLLFCKLLRLKTLGLFIWNTVQWFYVNVD